MAVGPAILNWTVQDFLLFSKLTAKRSSDGNFASTRSFRSRVLHSTLRFGTTVPGCAAR